MEEDIVKYRVESETSNTRYIVRYFPKVGKFACECPAYTFGKIGTQCKHIKKVIKFLQGKRGGVK
jgi:hypothetical protein